MSSVVVPAANSLTEAGAGAVVISSFHRTLAYSIAEGTFHSMVGPCGGGVGAMALAEGELVLLGRYSGVESVYGIYDLDVTAVQVWVEISIPNR